MFGMTLYHRKLMSWFAGARNVKSLIRMWFSLSVYKLTLHTHFSENVSNLSATVLQDLGLDFLILSMKEVKLWKSDWEPPSPGACTLKWCDGLRASMTPRAISVAVLHSWQVHRSWTGLWGRGQTRVCTHADTRSRKMLAFLVGCKSCIYALR